MLPLAPIIGLAVLIPLVSAGIDEKVQEYADYTARCSRIDLSKVNSLDDLKLEVRKHLTGEEIAALKQHFLNGQSESRPWPHPWMRDTREDLGPPENDSVGRPTLEDLKREARKHLTREQMEIFKKYCNEEKLTSLALDG